MDASDLPLRWIDERPRKAEAQPRLRARYDSAAKSDDNRRHWQFSDALSARAANDPQTRMVLRNRCRYERDNNGYCDGMVRTHADDLMGATGPRLELPQLSDEGAAARVKEAWESWCRAVGLYGAMHLADQAKLTDGETFFLLTTDDLSSDPVRLYPQALEAEQVQTPSGLPPLEGALPGYWNDGVELDSLGRPALWHVLRYHPGDTYWSQTVWGEYDRVPARWVVQLFRKRRPRQVRGVPEIVATLPLFAEMRRWTGATLRAAETAADFAAVLQSELPPDQTQLEGEPFDTLAIDKGMMTTLPAGYKLSQFAATQPGATYEMFKCELLKEAGRPISMPLNILGGDSSRYNYSSGRLDHLLYRRSISVERSARERQGYNPLFAAWLLEARLIRDYLPAGLPSPLVPAWFWPAFEVIDPETEAKADTLRLLNGTTTLAELMNEYGQNWEEFVRQRGKELALMQKLGVPPPTTTVREQVGQPGGPPVPPAPGAPRNGAARNGAGASGGPN